jgi:7-cyano-7-deazaguanine synthase
MKKVVVIFSGGQDSTTCLYWALKQYPQAMVTCLSFKYGQRHEVELKQAKIICDEVGVPSMVIDLSEILQQLSSSALLHPDKDISTLNENGLPASYVPNRNQLFITLAHAFAQNIGADTLVAGMCQTDYSGYPDCRNQFILSLSIATNLGSDKNIEIKTPLMYLSKAETFSLAEEVGGLDAVLRHSHTCYHGDRSTFNDWGYGCGHCPACQLRSKGYAAFMEYKRIMRNREEKSVS